MATQSSAPGVPQIEHHKLAQRLLVKATSTPPREAKRSRRASMVVHGSPTMSKQAVVDKAFQELCTPERKSAEGWLEGGREQRVSVGQLVVLLTPPEESRQPQSMIFPSSPTPTFSFKPKKRSTLRSSFAPSGRQRSSSRTSSRSFSTEEPERLEMDKAAHEVSATPFSTRIHEVVVNPFEKVEVETFGAEPEAKGDLVETSNQDSQTVRKSFDSQRTESSRYVFSPPPNEPLPTLPIGPPSPSSDYYDDSIISFPPPIVPKNPLKATSPTNLDLGGIPDSDSCSPINLYQFTNQFPSPPRSSQSSLETSPPRLAKPNQGSISGGMGGIMRRAFSRESIRQPNGPTPTPAAPSSGPPKVSPVKKAPRKLKSLTKLFRFGGDLSSKPEQIPPVPPLEKSSTQPIPNTNAAPSTLPSPPIPSSTCEPPLPVTAPPQTEPPPPSSPPRQPRSRLRSASVDSPTPSFSSADPTPTKKLSRRMSLASLSSVFRSKKSLESLRAAGFREGREVETVPDVPPIPELFRIVNSESETPPAPPLPLDTPSRPSTATTHSSQRSAQSYERHALERPSFAVEAAYWALATLYTETPPASPHRVGFPSGGGVSQEEEDSASAQSMEEKERRAKQDELVEDQTLDGLGRLSVSTSASSRDEGFFDAEEGDSFEDIDLSTRDGNGGRSTGGVEMTQDPSTASNTTSSSVRTPGEAAPGPSTIQPLGATKAFSNVGFESLSFERLDLNFSRDDE